MFLNAQQNGQKTESNVENVTSLAGDPAGEIVTNEGQSSESERFRKERKFREWSPTDLKIAVNHVLTKGWTIFRASRAFGIPYNTLKRRCKKGGRLVDVSDCLEPDLELKQNATTETVIQTSAFDPLSAAVYAAIKTNTGGSSTHSGAQHSQSEQCSIQIVPVEQVSYATLVASTQSIDAPTTSSQSNYYTLVASHSGTVSSNAKQPIIVAVTSSNSAVVTEDAGGTASIKESGLQNAPMAVVPENGIGSSPAILRKPLCPPAIVDNKNGDVNRSIAVPSDNVVITTNISNVGEMSDVHSSECKGSDEGVRTNNSAPATLVGGHKMRLCRLRPKLYEASLPTIFSPKKSVKSAKCAKGGTDPTLSLINVEKTRLSVEKERLAVEKERLKVECERLAIEKERLNLEKFRVTFPEVIVGSSVAET